MTMNTTSKQMGIISAIRQHVADRLVRLDKRQTHLISPHTIPSKGPQGFIADATINMPNGHLVASARHEDMYTVVNEPINKLKWQLNKVQHKGEVRRAATSVKETGFMRGEEQSLTQVVSCHAPSDASSINRVRTVQVL